MTAAQIVERRHKEGKTKLRHFNFVHGTALKMYIKEKEGDPEYPMRFLPKCQGSGVFDGLSRTQGVWVNSEDYIGKFLDCFPAYPKQNCVFSRIGVNQKIFCPRGTEVEACQDLADRMSDGLHCLDFVLVEPSTGTPQRPVVSPRNSSFIGLANCLAHDVSYFTSLTGCLKQPTSVF